MADEALDHEISMDTANLYREESFTDRRIGSIQRLVPVRTDGTADDSRSDLYVGQTQVLTPAGALPLSFEIEAQTLDEAIGKFGDGAKEALAGTMQKLEELRREQASSIIVPGAGGPPGMPGGGAMPGGGLKIP
ncbi:MAG: hypothetical protein OEQ25_11195 [Gammaproteobacteria bacterium]|nr:hypothetical protein [Gammaproteobacteria bacterium]MDH3507690.1 hypothetical protein [Gammaproteobacteria bacterium]